MNPRSGRTIPMYFKVSPEEKEIIDKKMARSTRGRTLEKWRWTATLSG